jgi:hypothetical protein
MTTKTKTTKVGEAWPAEEIRENTKARRTWVDAKIAEINTEAGRLAKSVGTGSYQHVVIYKVEELAAREQSRGTCQFCGGLQAIYSSRIVLHGYARPGDGYTVGRCAGVREKPAELSIDFARETIAAMRKQIVQHTAEIEQLVRDMVERQEWKPYGQPATSIAWRKPDRDLTDAERRARTWRNLTELNQALGQQSDHIERHVLPRFGQALAVVLL